MSGLKGLDAQQTIAALCWLADCAGEPEPCVGVVRVCGDGVGEQPTCAGGIARAEGGDAAFGERARVAEVSGHGEGLDGCARQARLPTTH
jgi:hypothetical protein